MPPFPTIKTSGLLLRQFTDDDLDNVFQGLSNPETIRYYGIRFNSREATKEQLYWFTTLEESGKGIWWAICSADNNEFYGAVGLYNIKMEHRKAELGYWLLPTAWGKGYMSQALSEVLLYGFKDRNLHRIEAFVETGNSPSQKILERYGFLKEGMMKDFEIKNGEYISQDIYAKFSPLYA